SALFLYLIFWPGSGNRSRHYPCGVSYPVGIGRLRSPEIRRDVMEMNTSGPTTYQWYQERGVDLYKDKTQITCSAHAINGGLRIDADAQSNLKGLFAAGEVAAGPHGADRLGGNPSRPRSGYVPFWA